MKTDKTTIFDLFQSKRRYIVPLFQRSYVWTQESQWQPLWDDIVAEAETTRRASLENAKLAHKHFLGALVLQPASSPGLKRLPVVDIIDGQQRLLSLQLFLMALRDVTRDLDDDWLQSTLDELTRNRPPLADSEEAFKVWPTSNLRDDLQTIADQSSPEALTREYAKTRKYKYRKWNPPRPLIGEAYLFFAGKIREFVADRQPPAPDAGDDAGGLPPELASLSPVERTVVLVEAVIRNIELVTIELDHDDDAQVIFETLNARGAPLTPADLIRNFIFLTATRQGLDVERIYAQYWAAFEETPFWHVEERQGRLKRSRLDLFLHHYMVMRCHEEVTIPHLYQEFRDWWDEESSGDVEEELARLIRSADVYVRLIEPRGSDCIGRFASRLRALDTSTVHPLVLFLSERDGVGSPAFESALGDIESYLVRRAFCQLGQKHYNRFFVDILRKLARPPGDDDQSASLRHELAVSQAESAIWPHDQDFANALATASVYRDIGPSPTQMLLEAIEVALTPGFGEGITINKPLSVEHVFPQHPVPADWPAPPSDGPQIQPEIIPVNSVWSPDPYRTYVESITHRLGNLTLVTQPLNASVSNGPYQSPHGKRNALINDSYLKLNAYFVDVDVWDEEAINARGEYLANLALKIWPRP